MADEFSDDEYHFSEAESTNAVFDEETLETPDTSGNAKKYFWLSWFSGDNLKRNILVGIGALVVLLMLYKFLGYLFSSSKPTQTAQAPNTVVQQPEPKSAPTPLVKTQSATTKPVQSVQTVENIQPVQTSMDPGLDKKLSRLQRGNEKTQDEISNINDNVDNLKGSLSNVANQISMLNKSIAMLTEEVKQQQEQIAKLKKKKTKKGFIRQGKVWVPAPQWFVQAVIPGRAWLISRRGKTLTVRKGSSIPGYGTVKAIDPHKGLVIMSYGKNIMYKVSDT